MLNICVTLATNTKESECASYFFFVPPSACPLSLPRSLTPKIEKSRIKSNVNYGLFSLLVHVVYPTKTK